MIHAIIAIILIQVADRESNCFCIRSNCEKNPYNSLWENSRHNLSSAYKHTSITHKINTQQDISYRCISTLILSLLVVAQSQLKEGSGLLQSRQSTLGHDHVQMICVRLQGVIVHRFRLQLGNVSTSFSGPRTANNLPTYSVHKWSNQSHVTNLSMSFIKTCLQKNIIQWFGSCASEGRLWNCYNTSSQSNNHPTCSKI